ncbi:MAG: hypothetical protein ACO1RX_20200 [Candidatus Sericytochromatia bacterium]
MLSYLFRRALASVCLANLAATLVAKITDNASLSADIKSNHSFSYKVRMSGGYFSEKENSLFDYIFNYKIKPFANYFVEKRSLVEKRNSRIHFWFVQYVFSRKRNKNKKAKCSKESVLCRLVNRKNSAYQNELIRSILGGHIKSSIFVLASEDDGVLIEFMVFMIEFKNQTSYFLENIKWIPPIMKSKALSVN